MTAKIIYGTAWYDLNTLTAAIDILITVRKKERTAELVISAVLQGFRAIDTGKLLWLHRSCVPS
jgi:hypothetical protein